MRFCTNDGESAATAWLALSMLPGLGPRRALALAEAHGGPEALLSLPAQAVTALGLPASVSQRWTDAIARARLEEGVLARAGACLVAWSDPAYPACLRQIAEPPLVLAVRGQLDREHVPAVAIVGARRASSYGRRVAEELATGLAQAGVTVVSGLAAGIDAAAHRGALSAGGRTVAVLGTGIDRVYPSWHAALARGIEQQGALVTEFPCGAPPVKHHFPRRNRIIAGLALATVVVEATLQSGSLGTARHALEEGREVFAVPGPLGPALQEGPHALIREGATLVRNVEDILEAIAPALTGRLAQVRMQAAAATVTAPEARILAALDDTRHVDDLIQRTALAPGEMLETLLALELRGLVIQEPGMRFRRRRAA